MAAADTSLVVVAYHRPDTLAQLLRSIDADAEKVVVNVDDDSRVSSVAVACGAVVVPCMGNPGFAAGVNRGVRASTREFVVVTNDDVRFEAGAWRLLVSELRLAEADVVVPALVNESGGRSRSVVSHPTLGRLILEWLLLPDEPMRIVDRILRVEKWRLPTQPEYVPGVAAAVLAARRQTFVDHPMPEEYFLYWEEREWFYLLAAAGRTTRYMPCARAIHHGGRQEVRAEKQRLLAENAIRCVRRTQGRRQAALAWPIIVGWQCRLVAIDALRALRGGRPSRKRLRARLHGLYGALRGAPILVGLR
ncbi:MAG: glycosyltransferase family 2 protein [Acidimicrobiia bacterium]